MPPQAPTFGATIGNTFAGSLEALTNFGKALVVAELAAYTALAGLILNLDETITKE